jgi:hypothetical protein
MTTQLVPMPSSLEWSSFPLLSLPCPLTLSSPLSPQEGQTFFGGLPEDQFISDHRIRSELKSYLDKVVADGVIFELNLMTYFTPASPLDAPARYREPLLILLLLSLPFRNSPYPPLCLPYHTHIPLSCACVVQSICEENCSH